MKMTLCLCLVFLATFSNVAFSQDHFKEGLRFQSPFLKTLPLIDSTQPADVQSDYLWLDQAFRTVKNGNVLDGYLQNIGYNDTSKFIAKVLFRLVDYDPITFLKWCEAEPAPYPYRDYPGRARGLFENHFATLANDTGRTGFLLNCDIIADIKATDTTIFRWVGSLPTAISVVVTCQILDTIKGHYIPSCPETHTREKGDVKTQSVTPLPLYRTPAAPGACTAFEYRPAWDRGIAGDTWSDVTLHDSTGDWVKRDSEYVVFLIFKGITSDSNSGYYNLCPNWGVFGTSGALYPVRNGKVVDPNDDFNIGAAIGLPVSIWKSRLRARISSIVNP